MKQSRPINNGIVGHSSHSGLYVTNPENPEDKPRIVLKPNGFHFEAYDFDDLVLPSIALHSPSGLQYTIGFDDTGALLINGVKFIAQPATLLSPNGTKYKIVVDDTGVLTTVKEIN